MAWKHKFRSPRILCFNEVAVSWNFYSNGTKKAINQSTSDTSMGTLSRGFSFTEKIIASSEHSRPFDWWDEGLRTHLKEVFNLLIGILGLALSAHHRM